MILPLLVYSPNFRRRTGVALVLVLGCLALLSLIVVAFLGSVKTDLQSSKAYADNNVTRMLADTAVNIVMSQIRQATTESGHSWASQPGMIRTFDTSGNLVHAYKLYTSGTMAATQANFTADLPSSASWSQQTALYTDLNEPVTTENGAKIYPILPDPSILTSGSLDGYKVAIPSTIGTSSNAVPMPSLWLYVLQDGSLVAPVASGSNAVTVAGASRTNPIVGRIAFWTDDETCKVNVNTAGGDGIMTSAGDPTAIANATFWSPPYFCAPDDAKLATRQPALWEFQRYPGHPATVALNNILSGLGWPLSTGSSGTPDFYAITPRYSYGGSKAGTVDTNSATTIPFTANRLYDSVDELLFGPTLSGSTRESSVINGGSIATQQQIAAANFFLTAHSRAPELNLFGQPRISMWPVWDSSAITSSSGPQRSVVDQLLAFCATPNASETSNYYYFTRKDCTSSTADIGISRNGILLHQYLDALTFLPVPGFSSGASVTFESKYSQAGKRQILTEMFDYIRCINIADPSQVNADYSPSTNQYQRAWDGTSSSSSLLFSLGRFQVAPSVDSTWGTQGFGVYSRLSEVGIQFAALGRGKLTGAVPASSGTAIYLSANYFSGSASNTLLTLPAAPALWSAGDGGGKISVTGSSSAYHVTAPDNTMAVQAFLLLQFTIPSQMIIASTSSGSTSNLSRIQPYCWVKVEGLDGLSLNGHSLGMTSSSTMIVDGSLTGDAQGANTWSTMPITCMYNNGGAADKLITRPADPLRRYPYYSAIVPISIDTSTGTGSMVFTSSKPIVISLYDGSSVSPTLPSNKVQSYTVNFPTATLPVPTVAYNNYSIGITKTADSSGSIEDRWYATRDSHTPNQYVLSSADTVLSMVLSSSWSDARVLATASVPASAFTVHPLSSALVTGSALACSFTYGEGSPYNVQGNAPMGVLVPSTSKTDYIDSGTWPPQKVFSWSAAYPLTYPMVPPTLTSGVPSDGDWDNGIGLGADGPWINKADEGTIFPTTVTGGGYPYFTSGHGLNSAGPSFFSPNRQVPSPGMFGSLSTGVDPDGANPTSWRTLLFRPSSTHFGCGFPLSGPPYTRLPDHLFLDLFWMPVVEPYAISEPFSTAGKVNLNYQIEPYTYVTRSTALLAVLATEKIAQVSGSASARYKNDSDLQAGQTLSGKLAGMTDNARFPLNLDATLAQFDDKFDGTDLSGVNHSTSPDIFRSASQICEVYLVPEGTTPSYSSASSFASDWSKTGVNGPFALVGDNVRERPYTDIYGRVTTKSNTYQIHYRVQSLQKRGSSDPTQWEEGKDAVTGEKRGATTIERYIDLNPTTPISDFAANASVNNTLETSYQFRTISTTSFHP